MAPWLEPADLVVYQTGVWVLPDDRPLTSVLALFLEAGEPPVYLGFGSVRALKRPGQVMGRAER